MRSLQRQQETVLLASILSLLEALPPGPLRADSAGSALTRGELLCKAFEAYRQLLPSAQISFGARLLPGQFAFEQGAAAAGELRRLWRPDGDGATTAAGHPRSSLRDRFYQGERSGAEPVIGRAGNHGAGRPRLGEHHCLEASNWWGSLDTNPAIC
jgi:hypothetical protein